MEPDKRTNPPMAMLGPENQFILHSEDPEGLGKI